MHMRNTWELKNIYTFLGPTLEKLNQNTWGWSICIPDFLSSPAESKVQPVWRTTPLTHQGLNWALLFQLWSIRELVNNEESQVPAQTYWIWTWHSNKVSRWFMWTFKLEKQWPKVPNPFPAQGLQNYCLILNLSRISPQVGKGQTSHPCHSGIPPTPGTMSTIFRWRASNLVFHINMILF